MEVLTFLLGILAGWLINHWYSVNMKQPRLVFNGGSDGRVAKGSQYHIVNVHLENKLRTMGIRPLALLMRKSGMQNKSVVERDSARNCWAQLLDSSGNPIRTLWWHKDFYTLDVVDRIDIKSGGQGGVIVFAKDPADDSYVIYNPISETDSRPNLAISPRFTGANDFILEVSYSFDTHRIRLPISVTVESDGTLFFRSGGFGTPL